MWCSHPPLTTPSTPQNIKSQLVPPTALCSAKKLNSSSCVVHAENDAAFYFLMLTIQNSLKNNRPWLFHLLCQWYKHAPELGKVSKSFLILAV
jgi:hypothetical protein